MFMYCYKRKAKSPTCALELYIFWVYKPHVEKYCNRTHFSSFLMAVNRGYLQNQIIFRLPANLTI
jgi:hypothetical protein